MYLPPNNDLHQHFMYGYVTHADQKVLYKLDLHAMKYAKTIDLSDFDCLPQGVAFIPLGKEICNLFYMFSFWKYDKSEC